MAHDSQILYEAIVSQYRRSFVMYQLWLAHYLKLLESCRYSLHFCIVSYLEISKHLYLHWVMYVYGPSDRFHHV